MKPRSLLSKIQLLVVVGLLGFGVMVSVAVSVLSANAVRGQVQHDVVNATSYLREFIAQERANLDLQTQLIAEQPAVRAIAADDEVMKDPATLSDRLAYYKSFVGADGLVFYGKDGSIDCHLGLTPSSIDKLNLDQFRDLGENQSKSIAGFTTSQEGILLSSTRPVAVGAQLVGVVTAYKLIGRELAGRISTTLGIEVAFQVHNEQPVSSAKGLAQLPADHKFHLLTVNGLKYGAQVFELVDPSSGQSMTTAVLRPEAEATQAYRKLTTVFFMLLPLALAGSMVLATRFARGITRPVDTVVQAASCVQQGQWPEELHIDSTDEIGMLQQVFNDTVSSLRTAQDRLLAMIDVDPLTELLNHRKFKEVLDQEAKRSTEFHQGLTMLHIDIDNFKAFNEQNGHAAGDKVLKQIADILVAKTPAFAIRSRFAGEQFVVLLPGSPIAFGEGTAEAIRQAVEASDTGVTVSIGCAEFGLNTSRTEGLTIASELALARAKQLGRNRVCRFDSVPGADQNADPFQLHQYMQDASLATIQALAAAVDAKDSYTEGHSRRVAQYAVELGRFIGLSETEIELIYRTGTLHDVGKIGVPDSILKKPDKLTLEEREIMETHPVLGEVIVRKAPQLEDTVPGVRNHHEAWDGNGYPDKLSGEDIPFVARVLAIADTFDAMTSDRPYRKGLSVQTALAAIANGAGTQFDPKLANAFVELMSEDVAQAA